MQIFPTGSCCAWAAASTYSLEHEAHAIALVEPHSTVQSDVLTEHWEPEPPALRFEDLYGNVCRRFELGPETSVVRLRRDRRDLLAARGDARSKQTCSTASRSFRRASCTGSCRAACAPPICSSTTPGSCSARRRRGAERVAAVCDWIHENVEYGVPSVQTTTAGEVLERRGGVCRDFAHLGVTFCRALGIPARYVSGYLPDIGIPGPYPTMDFHAWFEVWLGESWWTYDARFNTPRIGRVPIGRGRDAIDIAMVTTYGVATLETMSVWADEVSEAPAALIAGEAHGR